MNTGLKDRVILVTGASGGIGAATVRMLVKDDEKFITCSFEQITDQIDKNDDLMPLATTAVRRLEKLTSINKKISSETINSIKELFQSDIKQK